MDDASDEECHLTCKSNSYAVIRGITVVHLLRNLGHQRAIAIGLAVVCRRFPQSTVCVMDGDGEDDPKDIPRLMEKCRQTGYRAVVFAERRRRSEGVVFTACYHAYRSVHWLLTGIAVRFGNFSVIPFCCLQRLVVVLGVVEPLRRCRCEGKTPLRTSAVASGRSHHGKIPNGLRFAGRARAKRDLRVRRSGRRAAPVLLRLHARVVPCGNRVRGRHPHGNGYRGSRMGNLLFVSDRDDCTTDHIDFRFPGLR